MLPTCEFASVYSILCSAETFFHALFSFQIFITSIIVRLSGNDLFLFPQENELYGFKRQSLTVLQIFHHHWPFISHKRTHFIFVNTYVPRKIYELDLSVQRPEVTGKSSDSHLAVHYLGHPCSPILKCHLKSVL